MSEQPPPIPGVSQTHHLLRELALTTKQPPYPPQVALVGGEATVIPDVPPLAVFIALYLTFFAANIGLFNINRRKGHFFIPSALLGGFSMARVLTCSLRIGWATNHTNVSLAIAAMVFVNAGILIVYIVNILFAQRILRAKQPQLGWNPIMKVAFTVAYSLIGVALVLVIVLTVMSFYTLDISTLTDAKWIQRSAILYLLIITILPLVLLALAFGLPRPKYTESFGEGSLTSKAIILTIGSCLCVTIAGFKVGIVWSAPRPIANPAWYDSKAVFYVFNFTLEILILTLYTSTRVDKRFFVPNGSSKRRSYAVAEDSEDADNADDDVEKKRNSGFGGEGAVEQSDSAL